VPTAPRHGAQSHAHPRIPTRTTTLVHSRATFQLGPMHGHDNDRPYAYRRGRSSAPDPNYPPFPSDAKAARNQYITILPRSLHHEDAIVVLQTSQRLAAAQWRQKEQSLRSLRPRRRQHRRWQQHLQSRRRCTAHSNRKQGACSAAAAAAIAAASPCIRRRPGACF